MITPTPKQYMTAFLGFEKIHELSCENQKAAEQIFKSFYKKLKKNSAEYHTWKYIFDRASAHDGIIHAVKEGISIHENLIFSGPWTKLLTSNDKKLIEDAAATYKPRCKREEWLFAFGNDYDSNTDEIPEGEKITNETGIGLQCITRDGDLIELCCCKPHLYIELEINSWQGISLGAEHYYAKFNCYYFRPNFRVVQPGLDSRYKVGDLYSASGYGDHCKPRIGKISKITIRRPLTIADLKETRRRMNKDRYEGYEIGDMIDGFWTKEDAVRHSKEQFNKLFDAKTIELKIDDHT